MENIEFNNQSQIILRDQVSSVLHGTSLNWAILSSDTDAIKKLKDFEQIQNILNEIVPNHKFKQINLL